MPEFYMIRARKIIKIPEIFYDICPKNSRILHKNYREKIFPDLFFFGGGASAPSLPPVSYAYAGMDQTVILMTKCHKNSTQNAL